MSLLIIFVIVIIVFQIILFIKTGRLILKLKKVLSGDFLTVTNGVTAIKHKAEYTDEVTEKIETSINTYLRKNKGAVSDFNLIKDIVERNCDSLESEISSQTPIPLYLGLMGTVAGIILGLFTITINGGFSQIDKVIEILMSDVAIAMIASFMGIGLTTLSLWISKQCKVTVENNKNSFYTWIQTNLLPVISESAVSAITLLQKNLTRFNESFTGTVDRLEDKLADVEEIYSSQIEILEKIEAIDVKKMAVANVKILSALDGSMGSLDRFSQYMQSVTEYLTAVRDLNAKLDEHLERTETLGVVSDFYKSQMLEIGLRQDAIKSAVLSVDDVMKSALAVLKENSEAGLKSMQEAFISQLMSMQQMISKQTEQLTVQMGQIPQLLQRMDEISAIPSKLDKLIDHIEKSNKNLTIQIAQLITESQNHREERGSRTVAELSGSEAEKNPLSKWIAVGAIVIIAIVCIANLAVNILSYDFSRKVEPEIIETVTLNADSTIVGLSVSDSLPIPSTIKPVQVDSSAQSTHSVKTNGRDEDKETERPKAEKENKLFDDTIH